MKVDYSKMSIMNYNFFFPTQDFSINKDCFGREEAKSKSFTERIVKTGKREEVFFRVYFFIQTVQALTVLAIDQSSSLRIQLSLYHLLGRVSCIRSISLIF